MATVKKGLVTHATEWWVHLRDNKRAFWHGERRAVRDALKKELRSSENHYRNCDCNK